ncbi:Holliday junction resolvase RuvX [Pseudomaricurvus alkylphenolicus]|jgi:putative Holliday junction resolvase|uniref:Holliday junction resolvase RuvX n=1 Tax=Pseudomaricurvus alkylphenolicus TaxID=1306991 RepID=UPI001422FE23|nr:Holliday junction resolvase RuvX [Pseudomaricurvus alkylphenolicus]NIB39608.1 Holliday junction resolvase RuvX [Pseudomaricurvus alkylphenolicus]
MAQTLLAFDYGTRNIGVATGNTIAGAATEQPPLAARDGIPDWNLVEKLLQEWQPNLVLVGLPLNMDDSESELSTRARKFANRVHGRFGVKVELVDERLSTFSAKQEAAERGHRGNYGDSPIDSIAARLILESWLQSTR